MILPKVLTDLVKAQNDFDSVAYANCFAATATVADEGHTHTGKHEIERWIAKANKEYQATMAPLAYDEPNEMLTAEIAGSFPGSPIVLQYHFQITEGLVNSLKITGA